MFSVSEREGGEYEAKAVFQETKGKNFPNWWNSSIYSFKKPKDLKQVN